MSRTARYLLERGIECILRIEIINDNLIIMTDPDQTELDEVNKQIHDSQIELNVFCEISEKLTELTKEEFLELIK